MTQEVNRIDSELIPLKLFSHRMSEGWITAPMSDTHSAPDSGSEAHLMAFSFNQRQCRASATTLYVTGTMLELLCYSISLERLVMTMGEQPAELQ
jgi:hypothetical protein